MHTREKYWASKVPLPLALLFLVNVLLVIGLELLFVYKHPAIPEGADLAKYSTIYEDCNVVNQDSQNRLTASLVETADGQTHLVVTKGHSLALGRGNIIYAQPVSMEDSDEITVNVKNVIHTSTVIIRKVPTDLLAVTIEYSASGGVKEVTAWYMFLAAVLEALELLVIHFIKTRLQ